MDLRTFIDKLDQQGQLRRVSQQVDWKFEVGEITRNEKLPVLFENIKNYPGHRIFTNGLLHFSEIATALGLPHSMHRKALIQELRKRIKNPIPGEQVEGCVYDNIFAGSNVDLLTLPVPHWNRCDAGRYLGTWHINISRDPENGSHNLGVYRMQVLGPRHATISTSSKSHLGRQFAKAEALGRPLEVAVAIGVSESVFIGAAAGYPPDQDEYALAGALQGGPVPLVQSPSVGLLVPAGAEILIEGYVLPGRRVLDGPYFDYAGKATSNPKAYLFEATRMMFRNHPIFRGAVVGFPAAEDIQLFSVLSEVGLFDFHGSRLRRALQSFFLKERLFSAFQLAGRIGPGMFRGEQRGKGAEELQIPPGEGRDSR